MLKTRLTTALALMIGTALPAMAENISVLTPYMNSIPTHQMVEAFKAASEGRGWDLTVIDTRNDFGQLASRMEDSVNSGAKGIVLVSVDPALIADQVAMAKAAGIPVVTIDGAPSADVAVNVTSDNFELGTQLSEALFAAMGGKGNIVKFYHSAHPGVNQREKALDAALAKHPEVKVIAEHYVKVPGPIDDSRIAMENILRQHGADIQGVWAAFDDAGIGAELAISAERPEAPILIMGVDGNEQAMQMIGDCTHYKATFKQDFPKMAAEGADQLAKILAGATPEAGNVFVPAVRVDAATLGASCN